MENPQFDRVSRLPVHGSQRHKDPIVRQSAVETPESRFFSSSKPRASLRRGLLGFPLFLLMAWAQLGVAQEIALYAPGNLSDRFGSASSEVPFNRYSVYSPDVNLSMRYQQVIAPSSFSTEVLSGGWITAVSFRADEATGRFHWGGTLPDLQVNLSTTTKLPDALSPIFSENVGADSTLVFGRGSVSMQVSARYGPAQATSFGILFHKPFFYDPNRGSLLLDIRNYRAADLSNPATPDPRADAVDQLGDGLSRLFAGDVDATRADIMDSLGLVCYFNFTPVPEPAGPILLLLGGVGVFFLKRHASRR